MEHLQKGGSQVVLEIEFIPYWGHIMFQGCIKLARVGELT
jgi:hypothetical protein